MDNKMQKAILESLMNDSFERSDSIRRHLTRLLSSRRGTLAHLPDYGLPDVTSVYQHLPHSVNNFVEAIKIMITRYEPRLENIEVKPLPINQEDCVLRIQITGHIVSGEFIQFESYFVSGGGVKLYYA